MLVIIDYLTKIVHYKPIKTTIDVDDVAEIITNVVVRYYCFPEFIVSDRGSLFTTEFQFLLYYFLGIKQKLPTAFYPRTDDQIKRQNNTTEIYLRTFVNRKKNDMARLLPVTEFDYKNAKNASTTHTLLKLNCGYHLYVSFMNLIDLCLRPRSINKLAEELNDLMLFCQQNLLYI